MPSASPDVVCASLVAAGTTDAARELVALLVEVGPAGTLGVLPADALARVDLTFAGTAAPGLVACLGGRPTLVASAAKVLGGWVNAQRVTPALLALHAEAIVAAWRACIGRVPPVPSRAGTARGGARVDLDVRDACLALLHLVEPLPGPVFDPMVADAWAISDPLVRLTAVTASIWRQIPMDRHALRELARWPEARSLLVELLDQKGRGDLLPRACADLGHHAEAELAISITAHRAVLVRPEDIETLGRVDEPIAGVAAPGAAFVIRVRYPCEPTERPRWHVFVAGPYRTDVSPRSQPHGYAIRSKLPPHAPAEAHAAASRESRADARARAGPCTCGADGHASGGSPGTRGLAHPADIAAN